MCTKGAPTPHAPNLAHGLYCGGVTDFSAKKRNVKMQKSSNAPRKIGVPKRGKKRVVEQEVGVTPSGTARGGPRTWHPKTCGGKQGGGKAGTGAPARHKAKSVGDGSEARPGDLGATRVRIKMLSEHATVVSNTFGRRRRTVECRGRRCGAGNCEAIKSQILGRRGWQRRIPHCVGRG